MGKARRSKLRRLLPKRGQGLVREIVSRLFYGANLRLLEHQHRITGLDNTGYAYVGNDHTGLLGQ